MAIQAIPALNLIGNVRAAQYTKQAVKPNNFMQAAFSAENQQYNLNHPCHSGQFSERANLLDIVG